MREWRGSLNYGGVVVVISVVVNVGMSIAFFARIAFDDVVVVLVVSVVVDVQVSVTFVSSVAFDNGTWRLGNYRIIVFNFIVIVFVVVFLVVFSVVIGVVIAFVVGETMASADTA